MRRKSERSSKKINASPEKKVEKPKRTRTRRRKQSTSSENESANESIPIKAAEVVVDVEKLPQTPVKEVSPEEAQDQVWQVKAAEGSADVGEKVIHKLKICLTRPPSTPERTDRSPRSKRKHLRATSSSDTPSEVPEDKKKSKHRSKRSHRESKEESDKINDFEDQDHTSEGQLETAKLEVELSQNDTAQEIVAVVIETPMSTTNDDNKPNETIDSITEKIHIKSNDQQAEDKTSDADTTVVSPKAETAAVSPKAETAAVSPSKELVESTESGNVDESQSDEKYCQSQVRSPSVDKSEILDIHGEENKLESTENELNDSQVDNKADKHVMQKTTAEDKEVSISEDKNLSEETGSADQIDKPINETGLVENPHNIETTKEIDLVVEKTNEDHEIQSSRLERLDSLQSANEESLPNGQAPIVVSRKRRWGSRPSKLTTQKSITISTDVLKNIIPDVKPVEFEEVIEEKKHKRIEVTEQEKKVEKSERIERPLLPKIVIDNTENKDRNRKEHEDKRGKDTVQVRESHLTTNRKISIVKDNDSVIGRPPSPPRHKQSNILYITNLVRPFTVPQLKNLLQRTGKIVENGFWIDKIKSKCFVKYENEDQAVETRHALHGVTWPVSNPKRLQVDFSEQDAFDTAKLNEDTDNAQASTLPGTVEDWIREQDMKREQGEMEKPWERKAAMREWDLGKNEKDKDKLLRRDDRPMDKRRHRSIERSPEPAKKFKKKEEEAPAKLLDDLFRKTKTTPCIYWLPLSAETIAVKEEQRRQHMAEHERRLQELRRTHRRH